MYFNVLLNKVVRAGGLQEPYMYVFNSKRKSSKDLRV